MEDGAMIRDPEGSILIAKNIQFTRRSLKHFIESRTSQNRSLVDIRYLLERVGEVIDRPELKISNPKQSKHPGSLLLGRFYPQEGKAVMVVLESGKEKGSIISLHFRKKKDFYKLIMRAKGEK